MAAPTAGGLRKRRSQGNVCMQAGLRVHTYPEVLFVAANLTAGGGDCNPDKPPLERHISFGSASNILGDPEEVHMAPLQGSNTILAAAVPMGNLCVECLHQRAMRNASFQCQLSLPAAQ